MTGVKVIFALLEQIYTIQQLIRTLDLTQIWPEYVLRSFIASYKSITKLAPPQDFMNCVYEPIFWDGTDDMKDELMLHLIPPAELHLLIGPVNTMFKELEELWPEGSNTWAKSCHAYKEDKSTTQRNHRTCNEDVCETLQQGPQQEAMEILTKVQRD